MTSYLKVHMPVDISTTEKKGAPPAKECLSPVEDTPVEN